MTDLKAKAIKIIENFPDDRMDYVLRNLESPMRRGKKFTELCNRTGINFLKILITKKNCKSTEMKGTVLHEGFV